MPRSTDDATRTQRGMQRLQDEIDWENANPRFPQAGKDGDPVELEAADGWLQYRLRGTVPWIQLLNLDTLRVQPDPAALQAFVNTWLAANPPAAGKSVELQATATHIQWRQTSGTWADLIAISALKGADSTVPGPANSLAIGTVTTGTAGSAAAASITGSAPAQTLNLTLPRGATGNTGPSPKVALGTITLAQNALVAIAAGLRTLTFTGVIGVLAGDDLLLFPSSALPAGYAIHNVVAPANGQVQVTITAPLLAIGASYSIPCRVVALR